MYPPNKITKSIYDALSDAFKPSKLIIKDDTHKHTHHSQYIEGKLHLSITIHTDAFSNLTRIQQHRLVYQVLDDFKDHLHAISIKSNP